MNKEVKMDYKRETIVMTPAIAMQFLEKVHPNQRRYNPGIAEQFARDIRTGRWNNDIHQFDPLCFDNQGRLMNGQHRCNAVIRAGQPIVVDCLHNVPEKDFDYMDLGYKRNLDQFMARNRTVARSVVKFANAIENGAPLPTAIYGKVSSKKIQVSASPIELMDYYTAHAEEIDWVTTNARRIYSILNGGKPGAIGMALWLIIYTSPEVDMRYEIEDFIRELASDIPTCRAIANGKMIAIKKIIDAQRMRVVVSPEWWVAWVLATFEVRHTSRVKISNSEIEQAIPLYVKLLKNMREADE